MRFGITALDWSTVINQIVSQGSLDFNRFDFAEIVRLTHEQGFSLMELTLDTAYVLPGAFSEEQISNLLKVKNELDLTYTAHLPLWSLEPSSPNRFIRNASVECLVDAVNLIKPLNPEVYVVHNAGWLGSEFGEFNIGIGDQSFVFSILGEFAEQSLRELIQRTGIPSQKFALESIEFPFEITWNIAEHLDTSICLDTGHILSGQSGQIDLLEFVQQYYSRLSEIHLHDGALNPVEGKKSPYFDHQILGQGDLPIVEFLSDLEAKKFDGPIIFELTRTQAVESLEVIRKLLPNLTIN